MDKEGVFFIFKLANAEGRDLGGGGFIAGFGGGGSLVFGLVGANAPMPNLCFIDIPLPAVLVSSGKALSTILVWGLFGRCETFMMGDGRLAAILVSAVGTSGEVLLIRGTSGEDGAENKDVWEAAGEKMPYTRLLSSGPSTWVNSNSAPLLP